MSDSLPPPLPPSGYEPPSSAPHDSGLPDEWRHKFPDLRPGRKPPVLFRLNGFGLAMFGRRDHDEETGTYVKTYGITLLFIPFLPLASYRVADAEEGGWYFIGREKLSPLAKGITAALVILGLFVALSVVGANRSAGDEGRASRELRAAQALANEGQPVEAARRALEVAGMGEGYREAGLEAADGYLDAAISGDNVAEIYAAVALVLESDFRFTHFGDRMAGWRALCLDWSDALREGDPRKALSFASMARQIDGGDSAWIAPKRAALEVLVESTPDVQISYLAQLAELLLLAGEPEEVSALLEGHLPFEEGSVLAMHYGRALLRLGHPAEAAVHLQDHVDTHLANWLRLADEIDRNWDDRAESALDDLREGRGPAAFYRAYDRASPGRQDEMVSDYIQSEVAADARLSALQAEFDDLPYMPAVAMDLGIACLEAAHGAEDAEARTSWLERAEAAFLGIGSYAEDSIDHAFFLGQVYYWLGNTRQGAELFDQLIETHGGDAELLNNIGMTLRNVGEIDKARHVLAQALDEAVEADQQTSILISLAILAETLDEKIEYLEQAQSDHPRVAIDLLEARAGKAALEGDYENALELLQSALNSYSALDRTSARLNNEALVHFEMFSLGGGMNHFAEGLAKMDAAFGMAPNDSILCENAAVNFLASAALAVLGGEFEAAWLPHAEGFPALRLLYHDEEGREEVVSRFKSHTHFHRGRSLLERALILAPESPSVLGTALSLANQLRDDGLARQVAMRLDPARELVSLAEWIAGIDDEETVAADVREDLEAWAERWEGIANSLETERASALVRARIAARRVSLAHWLPDLEIDSVLAAIEAAYEGWPSSELEAERNTARALRAWRQWREEEAQAVEWAGQSERMVPPGDLLLLAALRFPEALDHPSLRSALTDQLNHSRRFPSSFQPRDAVLAAVLEAPDHERIAERAAGHPTAGTGLALAKQLSPHAPSTVLAETWAIWLEEGREAALAAYRERAAGHPWLPEL